MVVIPREARDLHLSLGDRRHETTARFVFTDEQTLTAPILTLGFSHMMRFFFRLACSAGAVLLTVTTACASRRVASVDQQPATPMVMPSMVPNDDATVTTAFRALLDEVIGDSADKVCLSIATATGDDSDPSHAVMRALSGRGTTRVLPRSACAADERNFGNPRGLLRLREVIHADQQTLIVRADAVGDHTARYECIVPASGRPRCKILARD